MKDSVSVLKDEENQMPIPSVWRSTIFDIVERLKEGDYKLKRGVLGVSTISTNDASKIAENIADYGVRLTTLSKETWDTSVCQWMQDYWEVLIDLYTQEEGESDLVLSVRVYEEASSYIFKIQSVHVP